MNIPSFHMPVLYALQSQGLPKQHNQLSPDQPGQLLLQLWLQRTLMLQVIVEVLLHPINRNKKEQGQATNILTSHIIDGCNCFYVVYSTHTYSVDWFNFKYLCNRWLDSCGVFGIGFRNFWMLKWPSLTCPLNRNLEECGCGEILTEGSLQNWYLYCMCVKTLHTLSYPQI